MLSVLNRIEQKEFTANMHVHTELDDVKFVRRIERAYKVYKDNII